MRAVSRRGTRWKSLGVACTGGHWGTCNLKFGPYRRRTTSVRSKFEVAGTPVATRCRTPVGCSGNSRHREIRERIAPAMGLLAPHKGLIYRWLWTVGMDCSCSCVDARHMGRTRAVSPQTLDLKMTFYSPVRGPHFWHRVHACIAGAFISHPLRGRLQRAMA